MKSVPIRGRVHVRFEGRIQLNVHEYVDPALSDTLAEDHMRMYEFQSRFPIGPNATMKWSATSRSSHDNQSSYIYTNLEGLPVVIIALVSFQKRSSLDAFQVSARV